MPSNADNGPKDPSNLIPFERGREIEEERKRKKQLQDEQLLAHIAVMQAHLDKYKSTLKAYLPGQEVSAGEIKEDDQMYDLMDHIAKGYELVGREDAIDESELNVYLSIEWKI